MHMIKGDSKACKFEIRDMNALIPFSCSNDAHQQNVER